MDSSEVQQNICVEEFISWKMHIKTDFFKTSVKRIIIRLMKVKIPKIMCKTKNQFFFYRFTNNNDKRNFLLLRAISKGSSFKHRPIPLNWIKIIIILVYPVVGFLYNDYSFFLHVLESKTSKIHHRKKNKKWRLIAKLGTKYHTTGYNRFKVVHPTIILCFSVRKVINR